MTPEDLVRALRENTDAVREQTKEVARLTKAFEGLAAIDPKKQEDPKEQLLVGLLRVMAGKGRKK